MRPTLLILASGNFALATGAFVVPGLLAQLSDDLGISLAAGGALMTSYAIAYAIASPLLVAATGAWTRRSVLLVGLALVAVGNLGMAAAGDLPTAVAARVVSAVGGALYTPIAAAIAVAVSPPGRRTRALALVFAGMTLAQVLGIPLGTQVAFAVGWRMVFVAVAVLALLAAVAVAASVPRDLDLPPATLPQLGRLLLEPHVAVAIAVTILFFAGNFVVMTFLGPVLTATSGATGAMLTGILWALGVAAVVANGLGGWAGDRFGPLPTLAVMITVTAAVVSILPGLVTSPAVVALLVAVWGLAGYGFMTPQQSRLVMLAPQTPSLVLALNAAALYVGSAVGGAIGSAVVTAHGLDDLGWAGGTLILASLAALAVSARISCGASVARRA